METILSGQKLDEEIAAIKRHLQALQSQKFKLSNEYVSPEEDRPKRVAIPQIPLAEPPAAQAEPTLISSDTIEITLKSLKPALSFQLSCPPTSTISELKALLVSKDAKAPPVDAQRWVFKGKALGDTKMLREYDTIKTGETIHLMIKAGAAVPNPDPVLATKSTDNLAKPTPPITPDFVVSPSTNSNLAAPPSPSMGPKLGHKLSMSIPKIIMDVDGSPAAPAFDRATHNRSPSVGSQHSPRIGVAESFRSVAASPELWVGVKSFLERQFGPTAPAEHNMRVMWEQWFAASKEWLTPGEIALIREAAGISGMGGQ